MRLSAWFPAGFLCLIACGSDQKVEPERCPPSSEIVRKKVPPVSKEEAERVQRKTALLSLLQLYAERPEPKLESSIWFLTDTLCGADEVSLESIPIARLWDLTAMRDAWYMGACGFVVMRDSATRCGAYFIEQNTCSNKPGLHQP